jgi:hypothetical protein
VLILKPEMVIPELYSLEISHAPAIEMSRRVNMAGLTMVLRKA